MACDAAQTAISRAVDGLVNAEGALVAIQAAPGTDRDRLTAWAADEATRLGAIPYRVSSATDLARALGGASAQASRDPALELALRLDSAAANRPRVVVVVAPDPEAPQLRRLHEALRTACRAGPVLALVDASAVNADLRVELPRLEDGDRAALTAAPTPAAGAVAGHVKVRSPEGVRVLLRAAVRHGALRRVDMEWVADTARRLGPGDPGVRAAHDVEASSPLPLTAAEQEVLATLWAAERPMSTTTLTDLTTCPDAVPDALEALRRVGLVQIATKVTLVHHARAREVAEALPAERRAALHQRLSHWSPPGLGFADRVLQQARHRLLAAESPDPSELLEVADALAAQGCTSAALALLDRTPEGVARDVARASVLLEAGGLDAAQALLADLDPGEDDDLRLRTAALLRRCAGHSRVLQLLDGVAHTPEAQLELARAYLWTGDAARADAVAVGLCASDRSSANVRAGAHCLRAAYAWRDGDAERAEKLALSGLDVAEDDRSLRADLLRVAGRACHSQGRHAEARRALAAATTENRALGRVAELARCLNNLGMVDYARGDWRRAVHTWNEFRVLCARVGDPVKLASACNNLGFLYTRLGQFERSARSFRRCIQLANAAGFGQLVPAARSNLGEALMLHGDLEGAAAAFEQAASELDATGILHVRIELQRRQAELALRRGDYEEANVALRELLLDEGLAREPAERGHVRRALANCELALDRPGQAVDLSLEALRCFDELKARFEAALCRETLARALAAEGDPFRAAHEAARALDTYLTLGAQRYADRTGELHQSLLAATSSAARDIESRGALLEVAHRLGATLDLRRLVPLVLDKVVSLVNAERGFFALVGRDGELQHTVVHDLEWAGPGNPLPVSRGLIEQVLGTGQTVAVQDVECEGDYGGRSSVRLLGLRSMLGVPVRHGDQVRGILYVDSRRRAVGDQRRDRELLEAFAALVGVCVENARLFAEQRFRAELLAKMAHDFRAPLSVIEADMQVIQQHRPVFPESDEIIGEIRASTLRMSRMIDDTLELSRADADAESQARDVDVESALQGHLEMLGVLSRQYEVDLTLKRSGVSPVAATRPDRLWIVVDNLVFNALKFAPGKSTVTVSVRLREDPGPVPSRRGDDVGQIFRPSDRLRPHPQSRFVEITIHNQGPPIREDTLERLFCAYVRGDDETKGIKSTGLGLAIVDQCVAHLGGRVWANSDSIRGTTFSFTLPQRVLSLSEATPAPLRDSG